MTTVTLPAFLLIGTTCLSVLLYFTSKKPSPAPLPLGPKGLPLVGNVDQLPKSQPWITFSKLGEKYGGIVYLNALGSSIIILNDPKYATEMLDKKSKIYSDRPKLVMAGELVGWVDGPALIPFCQTWTEYRRHFSQFMGTRGKIDAFAGIIQEETNEFLKSLLEIPKSWVEHSRRFAGGIVLMLAYGYKPRSRGDGLVKIVNEAMDQFSETTAAGAFLVDVFPSLRYVPSWLPGAGWKRKASKYRSTLQEMLHRPYSWTKQQMAAGTLPKSCFVSQAHENQTYTPNEEYVIQWAAAGIYSGGADTTVAGIECFVLAMTLHTEEQQRAQAEIDRMIGRERLPSLADRCQLPYFEALFTEILRTYTFGPMGLPHVVREDDIYNGYFIPKGSIVITNVWQFFHDSDTYPSPEHFLPERFLGSDTQKDPRDYLFGFGRRTCPGIHLADASMWLLCVSLLSAFNIRPIVKDGKPIAPVAKYVDGSISHPESFECTIKPRAASASALIQSLQ
ncbi:cytochrome P450 [Cyathus striatus]|nr:cytochrome P450 [Cyathus striatus]